MANGEVQSKPYVVTYHLTPNQEEILQQLTLAWNESTGNERTKEEMFDCVMTVGSMFDISKKMQSFEGFIKRNKNAPQV